MVKMKVTAIIILNYNNASDTINCIESVERFNSAPIKYILIDNGSNKDCVDKLREYVAGKFNSNFAIYGDNETISQTLPYFSFIISRTNDGYAKGNNKGLYLAEQDDEISDILILNNDILFVEDIISDLKEKLYSLNDVAIVSPVLYKKNFTEIDYNCARRILTLKQRFIIWGLLYIDFFKIITKIRNSTFILSCNMLQNEREAIEIELPSGSCMLIKKSLFKEIAYFDPNTFLYSEEDILYSKIKKLNKRNFLDLKVKCVHLGASTTKKSPSNFTLRCAMNSNLYYIKNYTDANLMYVFAMRFFGEMILVKNSVKLILKRFI